MTDDIVDLDDLEEMRKEIREFRKVLEEKRVERYNPEYHLSKEVIAEMIGVSVNRVTGVAKKWEERGVFEKVDVRYQNGRRGVGYVLLPDWKKNLLKVLEEESV